MKNLSSHIEALLFASGRPLSFSRLVKETETSLDEVKAALNIVAEHLNKETSGILLFVSEKEAALMTAPDVASAVRAYLKRDVTGELTRPSVETLAIIAYRGPITKAEMEQIRGVNCSLILRNLMMRGLVDATESANGDTYTISMACLRHLGVHAPEALPDFEALNEENLVSSDI